MGNHPLRSRFTNSCTMLVVWAVLSAASAQRAAACSCLAPRPQRHVFPADGVVDFPTDGRVRVLLPLWPAALVASLPQEYRLVDAAGFVVRVTASVDHGLITLTPAANLRGQARYTLEQVFAYDADGQLIDDSTRLMLASGRPDVFRQTSRPPTITSRRFFAVSSFTTTNGPSNEVPSLATITRHGVISRQGGGDCGPGLGFQLDYTLDRPLRATELLALELKDQGVVLYFPPPAELPKATTGSVSFGDLLCERNHLYLGDKGPTALRLTTLSATTTHPAPASFVQIDVRHPGSTWRAASASEPTTALLVNWFLPPLITTPVQLPAGPPSCAHGLHVTTQRRLGADGKEPPPTLAWLGTRAAVTVGNSSCTKNTLLLYDQRAQRNAPPLPLLDGCGGRAFFADDKIAVASLPAKFNENTQWDDPFSLVVTLYDAAALKPQWRSKLGDVTASKREPVLAMSPERMLVLWQSRLPHGEEELHLVMLAQRDGTVLGPVQVVPELHPLRDVAAIFDGEQFLIAARSDDHFGKVPGRLRLLRLDGHGKLVDSREVGGPSADQPALVRTTTGAALVYSESAGLYLQLLPRGGSPVGTPIPVSVGGLPRRLSATPQLAVREARIAIAWPEGDNHWITVVDPAGPVSPPLLLPYTGLTQDTVLTANADGFALLRSQYSSVRQKYFVELVSLACRTAAPPGAPARLVP